MSASGLRKSASALPDRCPLGHWSNPNRTSRAPSSGFDYVRPVHSNSGNALRVVLADDHHFFREGLRDMLQSAGVSVVGEAKDGAEAVALAGEVRPDLVVLDLAMPDAPGAEALRRIAAIGPEVRVIVLTATLEEAAVLEALDAGACGYILKNTPAEELIDGIRRTADSQVVLSREVLRLVIKRATPDHDASGRSRASSEGLTLTAREKDVLRLLAGGADNAAIGLELSISRHTVKQHVTNIFEKLGVHSRVEAAVYAVRTGLV
jgi:DNA-binding NarL/FixJ family response regulator